MIIVKLKPDALRRNTYLPETHYLNTGIGNWRITMRPHVWRPPTDVYEMEDAYVVRVEIAGMNDADFAISIDGNLLAISGIRPDPASERRAYHLMEISYGEFSTQVELPNNIQHDGITAEYSQGFLRITLPKSSPKQIHIQTD